jgi:chromosome segregation ATPase
VSHPFLPGSALAATLLVAGAAADAAHAQQAPAGQSMEERLRNQLRNTTAQLQQAQNELAVLKAGGGSQPAAKAGAAPADVDALKKELEAARAQLASERQSRDALRQSQQQGQAQVEKAGAQIAQYRGAYDELLRMARGLDAERQRLAAETTAQKTALTQCEAKNAQLYAVGQEVLQAYETVDLGTVLSARQPFAAQSRVRYEQIAQQFGDKLYEGQFSAAAAAQAAPPAPPAQSASQPDAAPQKTH